MRSGIEDYRSVYYRPDLPLLTGEVAVPDKPPRTSVIVTALGPDKHGLLAAVATTVAACDANVDDVSQTVTGGMFTMIMFVSFAEGELTLAALQEALARTGGETGLQITVQHEDIFRFMHRV